VENIRRYYDTLTWLDAKATEAAEEVVATAVIESTE